MTKSQKLNELVKKNLFDVVPMAIAVINKEFKIVYANKVFENIFGKWKDKQCFAVYKSRDSMCLECKGVQAFQDGILRVSREVGYNKNGRLTHYLQHTIPITDETGDIPFLVEMALDITEITQIKKENQLLLDQVPCSILLIDRNFRIAKTNKNVEKIFGNIVGKNCFEALKGLNHSCLECTAGRTFQNGQMHSGQHTWKTSNGAEKNFLVSSVPLRLESGSFDLVMEVAVDITQTLKLEDELRIASYFMKSMIASSMDGIIAVDRLDNVTIFNQAAKKIFRVPNSKRITIEDLKAMLPPDFLAQISEGMNHVYLPETEITTMDGEKLPARLTGIQIKINEIPSGMSIMIQNLSEIRQLEKEKLEAERLAAVGQTVAGLAHGIKNLINALEGGMYLLKSGINKNRMDRVSDGMDMLIRNIERVSMFVKEFLTFSKGREIQVKIEDPALIAHEVVELYAAEAAKHGIELRCEIPAPVSPAPMDYEGMHECLTNLVGNAIDACNMSEKKENCFVIVRISEKDDTLIFEVIDNGCGMDYEVKQKVFTNFFTTKGLGGAGLGLLTTKKIVQEHGGVIELTSEPGEGSTFTIRLPRNRLPKHKTFNNAL
jgi:PAS domain S-box-containing protein